MLDVTHPLSVLVTELVHRWWADPAALAHHPAVAPSARDALADHLTQAFREQAAQLALRTVITDFHTFRESLGLPPDPDSRSALQAYCTHLEHRDRCAALLERHPVLDRQAATLAAQLTTFVGEILQAFIQDTEALQASGLLDPGDRVTGLQLTLGDTHRHGRAVTVVQTGSGRRVVFKPRSLALDCRLGELWAVLNPSLRHSVAGCVPTSVDRGEHGWQAFIEHDREMGPEACARYFYRFGVLVALAGVWGATDLHHENVMTRGEHPVIIDLETILQPEPALPAAVDPHTQRVLASTAVGTLMLPLRDEDSVMDVLLSGLGVPWPQTSDQLLLQVTDADSDAMAVRRRSWSVTQDTNVPLVAGVPQNPLTWYADLRMGLRDALGAIRRHRTELERGLRDLPEHTQVRFVYRATEVYSRYLDALTHPALLGSDRSADEVLDLLAAPAAAAPEPEWFVAAERSQLRNRDIPLFTSRVGDIRVWTDGGLGPEMFVESAVDAAVRRMRTGCELSDDLHELVLETCCGELARGPVPGRVQTSPGLFGRHVTELTKGAEVSHVTDALRRQLLEVAIHSTDADDRPELGWIGGTGLGVATLDSGLSISFHDFGGVAAFLRRYASQHGGADETVPAAIRGWHRRARDVSPILAELPVSVLAGAATGPLVLGRDGVADLLERVPAAWGAEDRPVGLDVAHGVAGLALLLSSVPDHPGVHPLLTRAARRLADRAHLPLERPDHDLVHGRLGLWWGLLRAGRALGVSAWEAAGAAGLAQVARNLPPELPTGWCNGAAGIALALAEGGEHDGLVAELLERATGDPVTGPVDLSVCHGVAGIAQVLVSVDRMTGRGPGRAQAYFRESLQAAARTGFVNGVAGHTALPGYLLGWSGVADTALLLESPADALTAPVTVSVDGCLDRSAARIETKVGA